MHGKAGTEGDRLGGSISFGGGDVVPAGFEGVCGSGIGRQSWKWRDRGVWVSYLDWNGWAKDEAGYKKAMDQTLDLCVQKGLNAVFLQVRPDGDAMYPSQYFPWSKFASGKQGKNPGV